MISSSNCAEFIESILAELAAAAPSLSDQTSEQLRKRLSRLLGDADHSGQAASERRILTVMVTTLRGFDALAAQRDPDVVVKSFNRYLTYMNDIVNHHGGIIHKVDGDSLTILFGVSERQNEHAAQALACAAEMQQAMSRYNQQNEVLRLPSLYMGIGIHSGELVMGGVGATLRREFAVLGGAVGIAERIAKHTLRGQVLLSDTTYRLVHEFVLVGELNTLRMRSRHLPVTIYELLGTTRPRALSVPRREARKSPRVLVQMPCYFQRVKNNDTLGSLHCGRVLDMGYHGLRMISPVPLDASSEIMMSLSLQLLGNRSSDIYARIVTADAEPEGYRCTLEFTNIDLVGRQTIKQFVDNQVTAI